MKPGKPEDCLVLKAVKSNNNDSIIQQMTKKDMTQEQKTRKHSFVALFLRALAIFFFIMGIYYFGKAWFF